MQITPTKIPEVVIIEPRVFQDERGFFLESFNQRAFDEAIVASYSFVQDNHSSSAANILRGLHYQVKQAQGKLVRAVVGSIYDVAVDIRQGSPTFGKSVGKILSAENKKQLWIPPGFAHGFYVLSETADVLYKATDFYSPADERCLVWNDPALSIQWPTAGQTPVLSDKDAAGETLASADLFDYADFSRADFSQANSDPANLPENLAEGAKA
ncbi:dTDP-4-dehydrorhamnose 3,5-epimerase [soil metagenome]|nr:dTDP-4-dehydrorhamnose 3,5-epimerase [Leptolyngbya sp. BC1307]